MLSRAKNLSSLHQLQKVWRLMGYTQDSYSYHDGVSTPLHRTFCTATEPLEFEVLSGHTELLKSDNSSNSESPKLPGWVTFPGKGEGVSKPEDDDFVPPSVSYWIDNHKILNQDADMKNEVEDIVQSDIDKISKILKNPFESPDLVVKALDGCGVNVSDSLVEQVLKRFSCEWIQAFGFFRWAESSGITLSPDLYNLMVDNLGKMKKFDLMWGLVREMKNFEGYVTLKTITKVMICFIKTFQYDKAIKAFKEIELFGIDKDVRAMNALMASIVKEGSVELAEEVFLECKDEIPPSLVTYNILVHGWCKARMIDKAKRTVEEMKVHGFQPDSITYTTFIEAYCREKDFRNVDATLEEMRNNGHPPNVVTYTIVVAALSRSNEINKVLEIYEKIKEEDCPIDASFCSVFVHALCKSGRVKDSEAFFYDMLKQGISPNRFMYNSLIKLAAENLQEEKALKLLLEIEQCGLKPDLGTYTPLFKMCCKLNRIKVLTFLRSHMLKNDVSFDLGAYALLIKGLCKIGKLERASQIFEEMVMKGFVPTEWMCKKLVGELEKNDMSKEKESVEKLIENANQVKIIN